MQMENDNPQSDDQDLLFDELERKLDEQIATCGQMNDYERGLKDGLMQAKIMLFDIRERTDFDGE